jgi:hypothetical protein
MAQCTTIGDEMVQAADHGLLVLGEIVREAIYERIERTHQVKREEIPEKLDTFHKGLQVMLGAPVKVVERLIAKDFYGRLGLNFNANDDWTIVEYFDNAKKLMGIVDLSLIKAHSNVTIVGLMVG